MTKCAVRILTLIAVAAGVYFACRGVSPTGLARVFRAARLGPLAPAAVLLLGTGFLLRGLRFRTMLGETGVLLHDFVATAVLSQAANNVLPLRAGEFVKTRDFVAAGQPLGRVLAAQAAEKLIEGTTFVLLCGPALSATLGYGRPLRLLALILVAGIAVQIWTGHRFGIRPSQVAGAFAWSLAADAIEVVLVAVTLRCLGLPWGFRPSFVVLGAVNLAIALPSVPGHVGVFEAGAALGLIALGVGHDAALAFALLYRMVQWIPVTAMGGVVWAWRASGRGQARAGAS